MTYYKTVTKLEGLQHDLVYCGTWQGPSYKQYRKTHVLWKASHNFSGSNPCVQVTVQVSSVLL